MQEKGPFRFVRRRLRLGVLFGIAASLCLILGTFPGRLSAQSLTSTVTGTVTDPTGAVIVGAKVTLTLTLTGSTRATKTNARGNFIFDNVPQGTYEIRITQSGFNTYDRKGMSLAAGETLSLHKIALKVGATTTSVTVTGEAARVNTYNGNGSGLVNEKQMSNIPDKGRNYMDYLQLLPGTEGTPGGTNAPGWGKGRVTFNGGDSGTVLMLLNGVAVQDSGAPGAPAFTQPSVSSIAEERVHTGVESAQYGGRAGGTVDVVTKHGTSQFHGSLYYYNRNNFYNANDYFRKQNPNPAIADHPAPYKYNDFGGTIGGPILLPGLKYNSKRQRAFFFFSYEGIRRTTSGNETFMTTPTPAERAGVFTNLTQNLVNPGGNSAEQPTCSGASPDITCSFPSAAISPAGQGLLNVLPMPTCLRAGDSTTGLNSSLAGLPSCSNNTYNFNYVNSYPYPWHNDVLRTDFKLSNNELFYIVLQTNREEREGYTGFLGGSSLWPQSLTDYLIRSRDAMGSLVSTLSPTVVNSFTLGTNYAIQSDFATNPAQLSQNNRAALGLGPSVLPVLFPDPNNGGAQSLHVNPYDLIPNVSFGGQTNQSSLVGGNNTAGSGTLPNASSFGFESRYPFFGTDWDWTVSDNLSWVKGNHNMMFGMWYEHVSRSTATYSNRGGGQFNGILDMTSNGIFSSTNASGSPFDTGNTFANAIVGAFNRYASDNTRYVAHGLNHDVAWFAQDDWQVLPHLTLDLGIRFTIMTPDFLRNGQLTSEFQPQLYNGASQPSLILPCVPSSGANAGLRVGCESNGTQVPASAIGLYDPSTYSGTVPPYSGMLTTTGYVYNMPKIQYGPRFGFAWDVFGNGKTALRGGFGIFYDRTGGVDDVLTKVDEPPLILSPAIYNSTFPQMLANPNQQTFLGPQNVRGPVRIFSEPQVYDFRLGVEQNMTHGMLLDVAYVGDLSRHFQRVNTYNGLPYGENFQSAYQDPTSPAGTPYIANIIRCMNPSLYCGYGDILFSTFNENSNYNALQVSLNKRFGSNFIGGLAYTWSKVLDYGGCCDLQTTPYLPGGAHYWYGTPGQDRRQNLTLNWHYNLPNAPFQGRFAKTALNGWSIEGIASFISGGPIPFSVSYSGDPNGGGGPLGAVVSHGTSVVNQHTTSSGGLFYLNQAAVSAAPNGAGVCGLNQPALCGLGNSSPRSAFIGPGTNDWNVSLLKRFPLGNTETRYVQFRWETYNTFNHPQFSNPNASAHFSGAAGSANTNSTFGQITSLAVPARVMEFALGIHF